jgi:hypothetical protein
MTIKRKKEASNEISFHASQDEGDWVMKVDEQGILFNREVYSDSSPDEFAKAVIKILENEYTVRFEPKSDRTYPPKYPISEYQLREILLEHKDYIARRLLRLSHEGVDIDEFMEIFVNNPPIKVYGQD